MLTLTGLKQPAELSPRTDIASYILDMVVMRLTTNLRDLLKQIKNIILKFLLQKRYLQCFFFKYSTSFKVMLNNQLKSTRSTLAYSELKHVIISKTFV